MQFTSTFFSLALASSVLAAPTIELEKRANTCAKIGVTSVAAATTYGGENAVPVQCSQVVQYAGFSSYSYDHVANTCSYYNNPVASLNVQSSSGSTQIFWDKGCGNYSPTCGVQIGVNADGSLKWGQQYLIANLANTSENACLSECDTRSNCYAMAITNTANQCLLFSQTTAFMNANSPPLSQATKAIYMNDLFCGTT